MLTMISEKSIQTQKDVYLFIDYAKAFDIFHHKEQFEHIWEGYYNNSETILGGHCQHADKNVFSIYKNSNPSQA